MHPFFVKSSHQQNQYADEAEIRRTLIRAISHLNTLGEGDAAQWEMAIAYFLLLILHRRPVEQHESLKTVVTDQIPLLRRKEVTEMVYSMANRLRDEGIEQGIEQGTEQARTAIAIAMLNDNQPIDTIVKYTGLSKEMIEQLAESVNSST